MLTIAVPEGLIVNAASSSSFPYGFNRCSAKAKIVDGGRVVSELPENVGAARATASLSNSRGQLGPVRLGSVGASNKDRFITSCSIINR